MMSLLIRNFSTIEIPRSMTDMRVSQLGQGAPVGWWLGWYRVSVQMNGWRSAGGLMAGLVSSVYKWMDGGDNGGACLEPVGALWQRHISSSGSPAHTQPSTILTILNTALQEEMLKNIFYVNSRPSLWWLIWYTVISRSWRKLGVSFSPSRLVMVGLYSLPTQAALTGQCFF